MSRVLVGLSVGSGLEGADGAAVRGPGVGLALTPAVAKAVRVLFPPAARDQFRPGATPTPDLVRNVADTLVHAARTVVVQAGASGRDVFAAGLLTPARAGEALVPWAEVADRVAEQTGFTVVHGFRARDRAAGGTGQPITPAADYLLFRSDAEDRVLVHLGAATQVVFVPAAGKLGGVVAFEAGPGNELLDAMVFHGTRGRDPTDPGGKKAVQGCCLDPLLARWLDHPHLTRRPPKAVHPDAFGRSFQLAAFDAARQLGAGLPDLLCTATHLAARSVASACRDWLPPAAGPRRVVLSGGGVRNGFLWQRLVHEFAGTPVVRTDEVGVPPLARSAAAAAVLAALTCDGVPGNLAVWTGAAGGRLIGQFAPGDGRNWARLTAWAAEQAADTPRAARAA
ncbi:MAG TPA: anhydro-N-acetylmuramic acid kinase [Urbifossiella sp.]|jgi:anhydro-N-acetylmuramic acid kinase|nr:anhydro-N-acetylmuramic acid kinase [Urbifossiella sp.]